MATIKFRSTKQRNDFHRDTLCAYPGASLVVTPAVKAAFEDWNDRVLRAVVEFKDFSKDNDPWGEHDMGFFEVDGRRLIFKWDDYGEGPRDFLPEGMGPLVLTVMMAEDY